jgi:WD40 repeat protein
MRRTVPSFAQRKEPNALESCWRADMDGHHVIALRWSPDGRTLAAATADGPIALFDAANGTWRHTLPGHALGTLAIAWRPDSAVLTSAGQDGKIRFWERETGAEQAALLGGGAWVERIAWSEPPTPRGPVARGRNAVSQPAPAASAAPILASAAGKVLRFWDESGTLLREVRDHPSTIADLAWMPGTGRITPRDQAPDAVTPSDSSAILAVATYGGLTLRRPDRDEPLGRYAWQGSTLVIAWSPDGSYIATGDQDSTVHFWITRTGTDLQMWGYPTKVRELAWDASSRYLATGGGSGITVWDCSGKGPEGTRPLQLEAHEGQLAALTFQRRNAVLASGCGDGLVATWSVGKSKRPLATAQFASGISQVAWSPDDRLLAVGTEQGDVAVFAAPS